MSMRQAAEAQLLKPHCDLGEEGLRQILADVIEEVRQSISLDIDGGEVVHSLLNASWLQSLLKVYECLQRFLRDCPTPVLNNATAVLFQLLIDVRGSEGCSEDAKELCHLLRQPHLQALLSAHDTVAQRDYGPVLPPMPDELPEDEEATRTVCLVKNNQPLRGRAPLPGSSHSRWDALRRLTRQEVQPPGAFRARSCVRNSSWCHVRTCSSSPPGPRPPTCSQPISKGPVCRRRGSCSDLIWDQSANRSVPLMSGSALIDISPELDSGDQVHRGTSPAALRVRCCCGVAQHRLTPPPAPGASHVHTAPPSPRQPQRAAAAAAAAVELSRQASLDELRSTVQLAATSMESSIRNIQVLGGEMAATTEQLSDTVHGSCQALVLLTRVVEQLQSVLAHTQSQRDQNGSRCSARGCPEAEQLDTPPGNRTPAEVQREEKGATIKRHEITGEIFIARVIHGGLADRSGLLHAGDRIIEVNGFSVGGMEPEQVIHVVQARSQGTIMFKVVPITERPVHHQMMLYVRATVNYNPQQDPTIPCADAGVAFRKGDILEIVDQTDALWWQARKLPEHAGCAGLVPSSSLLQRKQRELWWSQPYLPHACMHVLSTVEEEEDLMAIDDKCVEADEETFESDELREAEDDGFGGAAAGSFSAGFRRSLRLCRRRFYSTAQLAGHIRCPSNCGALNIPYEEVVRYQRQPQDAHRLVALLGPSGVGVNELRKRLIQTNPGVFQGAVPHTTRPPKDYEEPGRDYHFTSREIFDSMMYKNRFLEYGEYKGNLYGTSIESVKDVLSSGKICIVDIEPNAIQAVRTHELKAYIIYVKPPTLERLRESRETASIATSYYVNRPFQDEDFQEMEAAAQKIESHYWQFFDHVLVNDELQDSCVQLLTVVNKAQDEPQWVPSSWIRPNVQL